MPEIRPFRALRYDPETVGDAGQVMAPPYDVIGEDLHRALLARHPRNAVRLDLPAGEPGEDPDERYRRAARTLTAWRSDGTLRKDPRPSVYVYQQTYRVPGTDIERTQRGFFARLRIEPFGPGSSVLPHERTLSGPKEDRYRLLRATGINTSPVVGLYEDATGSAAGALAAITAERPRSRTSRTMTGSATACGSWPMRARDHRHACSSRPPRPAPSSSPTAITGTRPRSATGTSAARPPPSRTRPSTSC